MLDALFGNSNISRILLFLFVNGRCYGMQLHRLLGAPLTPIQKALLRLEKGGIITSYLEGKTRLYQFNPAFSMLEELELLLKKAYHLLPATKKREFYATRDDYAPKPQHLGNKGQVLLAFWEQLSKVTSLTFTARSKSKDPSGWNGKGRGEVQVSKQSGSILIFNEKGCWHNKQSAEIDFSNIFRWTLDKDNGVVSLEHLRRGAEHPVFLFDLAPSGNHSLTSVDSHLCGGDAYFGQVHFDHQGLRLHWRIIGPKKNEELSYYYS